MPAPRHAALGLFSRHVPSGLFDVSATSQLPFRFERLVIGDGDQWILHRLRIDRDDQLHGAVPGLAFDMRNSRQAYFGVVGSTITLTLQALLTKLPAQVVISQRRKKCKLVPPQYRRPRSFHGVVFGTMSEH